MDFIEGRADVECAPAAVQVEVEVEDGLPRLVPLETMPELTDELIRSTIEATRR